MQCPKCKSKENDVLNTRKGMTNVSRLRQCLECGYVFSTKEYPDKEFSHPGYRTKREVSTDPDLFNNHKD